MVASFRDSKGENMYSRFPRKACCCSRARTCSSDQVRSCKGLQAGTGEGTDGKGRGAVGATLLLNIVPSAAAGLCWYNDHEQGRTPSSNGAAPPTA